MTSPRPPLRLVDTTRAAGAESPADAGDGAHPPPRGGGPTLASMQDDDDVIDAAFPHAAGDGDVDFEDEAQPPLPPRFIVLGLIAFQLLGALSFLGKYIDLTRTGTISPAAAVLAAPASACLYAGALLLALRPGRGRALFWVAAVGLGVSVAFWGISYDWTWPIAFGSMLGLAGAWYARAETATDAATQIQP